MQLSLHCDDSYTCDDFYVYEDEDGVLVEAEERPRLFC
jgi:hypothetical protein